MDLSVITEALIAGAAERLNSVAGDVVSSAYQGLKEKVTVWLSRPSFILPLIEAQPDNQILHPALTAELQQAGRVPDAELVASARSVLDLLAGSADSSVMISGVKGQNFTTDSIRAENGAKVVLKNSQFTGNISLGAVTARNAAPGK